MNCFQSIARCCLVVTIALLCTLSLTAQQSTDHVPEFWISYEPEPARNRMVILINFLDPEGVPGFEALDLTQGAPFDSRSYELTDEQGNPVPFQPVTDDLEEGILASHIKLLPKDRLSPGTNYRLKIHEGVLVFKVKVGEHTQIVRNKELTYTLEGEEFKLNVDYFERERSGAGTRSVQLLGGSAGGVGSARLRFDKARFVGLNWLHFRLEGSADFALDTDDSGEYYNNVSGEMSFYTPIELFPKSDTRRRYMELAMHAKTESDQEFTVTDGLMGVKCAIYPKDSLTRWLGTLFVPTNTHVGALLIVGYDYVQNLGGDATATAASSGIDTERADHRATALLRWRVPMLDNFDFSFLPALGGRYDLDLDLELKGVYDVQSDRFLDQSRISLQFTRVNEDRFKPSLVFTWARGKEAPTWKEVNALLAGLKLSF